MTDSGLTPKRARTLAVVSGRGGAGKTQVALNLAICLAKQGQRVCLVDADPGPAGAAALLGVPPSPGAHAVLSGQRPLADLLAAAPAGVRFLPSPGGLDWLAVTPAPLDTLFSGFDYLVIDTPSLLGPRAAASLAAVDYVMLLLTPEPTAVTDAFTMVKALSRAGFQQDLGVLMNRMPNADEAQDLFKRFNSASRKYVSLHLQYLGFLPEDAAIEAAVSTQVPVSLFDTETPAGLALRNLARRLLALFDPPAAAPAVATGGALNPRELLYTLMEQPDLPEGVFLELIEGLETAFRQRFGRPPRDPLERLYEAFEDGALPEPALRLMLARLHRRLYGEAAEERMRPLLEDQLAAGRPTPEHFYELLMTLELAHRERFGSSLGTAAGRLGELAEALQAQRPALVELEAECRRLLAAVAGSASASVAPADEA